jgi:hypothetical protein
MAEQIEFLREQSTRLTKLEGKALHQALTTEKSSLREAYHKGMTDAEDWLQLSFAITISWMNWSKAQKHNRIYQKMPAKRAFQGVEKVDTLPGRAKKFKSKALRKAGD